eukprot:scaffold27519_cov17-Tisochrysis_lutea.AAC.3
MASPFNVLRHLHIVFQPGTSQKLGMLANNYTISVRYVTIISSTTWPDHLIAAFTQPADKTALRRSGTLCGIDLAVLVESQLQDIVAISRLTTPSHVTNCGITYTNASFKFPIIFSVSSKR